MVLLMVLMPRGWTEAIEHIEGDDCADPTAFVSPGLMDLNADAACLAVAEWAQAPEYWVEVQG